MQLISFVALTILTLWSIPVNHCEQCSSMKWSQFKVRFGRKYESLAEDKRRQEIFCRTLGFISGQNKRNLAYKLALNQFADQTDQEMASSPHPTVPFPETTKEQLETSLVSDEPPSELDWSKDPRVVGPVKNQGKCNGAWAFAEVALLEAQQHRLQPNLTQLIPLSEQQLIDCDPLSPNCVLDIAGLTSRYIRLVGGLEPEVGYPFDSASTGERGPCRAGNSLIQEIPVKSFITVVGGDDEQKLKRLVAERGPVVVFITTTDNFRFYSEGVFYDPNCEKLDAKWPSHMLLLVGYGTDQKTGQDYWLLKNSWGTNWGMKGYVRLARNRDSHCGIARAALFVAISY